MSIILRTAVLCGGLVAAACTQPDGSTALGAVGSPAWQATASPEAKAATYRANCQGYGYTPGTPAMAQCMQQEALSYRDSSNAALRTMSANMAQMSQRQPAYQPPVRLQTSCTTMGNTTNCY